MTEAQLEGWLAVTVASCNCDECCGIRALVAEVRRLQKLLDAEIFAET